MRINKYSIIWASTISAVSLGISIMLQCNGLVYVSNLSAGIFASGFLALLIAIISYRTERKRTLERFYSYSIKALWNFNRFENNGDLERSIDSVLTMCQFDYTELGVAYRDIDFIFKNKKNREYISKTIYYPIITLKTLIVNKSEDFRRYRNSVNGNTAVMKIFITEIDTAIMYRTEREILDDDGTIMKLCSCKNQIFETLHRELNGTFLKIMYPHRKEEIDNAE